eukprot:TRINITY_DN770_c0_g1_i1.p1 TRINITY_DN770_c0_g1~~TRINITY_DN770_c0_g1_i1.p1  ORF type:complete len:142 (-),score=38.10 TRINITY_DN770_c0_g1_i1:324-749(-)
MAMEQMDAKWMAPKEDQEAGVNGCLSWPTKTIPPKPDLAPSPAHTPTKRHDLMSHIANAKEEISIMLQEGRGAETQSILSDISYMEQRLKSIEADALKEKYAEAGFPDPGSADAFMEAKEQRVASLKNSRGSPNLLAFGAP